MSATKRFPRTADPFGLAEWFRPGERERVESCLDQIEAVGASSVRTHLSWADYHTPGGREWYDWLIPTIARRVDLLPCIHYTPPSLSRNGTCSGPPHRPRDLADFVDHILNRYGENFTHLELWNEPNNLLDWDWRLDPGWNLFCEMIGAAAYWAEKRGWRTVLGGPCPFDLNWLDLMGQRGLLKVVSAVGIHGFPGTWDSENGIWAGWDRHIAELRTLLRKYKPSAGIWITEAGYSTWRHDELEQARRFLDALDAPADRIYWYALADMHPDTEIQQGRQFDIRHYHVGILDNRERDKLLARLLKTGGVPAVRRKVKLASRSARRPTSKPILITGGAGFIGSNLADALLTSGEEVIIFDNLSRPGVGHNVDWLRGRHGDRVIVYAADLRDTAAVTESVAAASAVFHLAAQVAVTESLEGPLEDFTINAAGTLHLLEALRRKQKRTPLIFASTNKVYGSLDGVDIEEQDGRYAPVDPQLGAWGLDERQPLQFSTPYGCSKGAADQYVLDYARSFDLPTVVLRMSCIYGPRQFGTEDQGWVAHFLIRALKDQPVTLFGDGRQVRDVLYVEDAVHAYRTVLRNIDRISGQAFNLGGGVSNAVSLVTLLNEVERKLGRRIERLYAPVRTGDQRYYVADTRRLNAATGWRPRVGWKTGVGDLANWMRANSSILDIHDDEERRSISA